MQSPETVIQSHCGLLGRWTQFLSSQGQQESIFEVSRVARPDFEVSRIAELDFLGLQGRQTLFLKSPGQFCASRPVDLSSSLYHTEKPKNVQTQDHLH